MTHSHNLPAAAAGLALLLCACAAPYDPDRVDRRTSALYGGSSASASDPEPSPRSAPPTSGELADYVAYGLAHSADLRAAFEHWRASTERVEVVGTLPDPRLTYGEFLEELQTRTGPQERRVGVSQAFPWPGRLAAERRVAEREAEAAWQRVESTRLRVTAEIEVAFHEYAFLGREDEITNQLLRLLRGLEPVVQSRIRAGAGQGDVLRLQVEIGRLEDDLASIVRHKPVLSARLASAVNLRAVAGEVLPVSALVEPGTPAVDVAQLVERAFEHNPRLLELGERVAASREGEAVAGYRRKPSFALGVDYMQTGEALDPASPGSGDDPVVVSLSLTLPIWTASYAAAERAARHEVRGARAQLEVAEARLIADIEDAAYRVDDAARRIALYRDSLIPRAGETLELTLASYRTGQASVLDLIDSERTLLEFELSFWRACLEFLRADAGLRALTGGRER